MDSLTQLALGASVAVATMGRRTRVWQAALWGGVAGTLPDLDVFVNFGDPVLNMVLHRSHSHSLFWLALLAPLLAALAARVHRQRALWPRWTAALALALLTHPLLDALTVYGTQLLQPFSHHPFGTGSVFIIDPAYTVPLLLALVWALAGDRAAARHAAATGMPGRAEATAARGLAGMRWALLLTTAYLAWGLLAQQLVRQQALAELARQGLPTERVLVTPTPFNTLLWRIVAMQPDGSGHVEGFRSLLDRGPDIAFDRFPSDAALAAELVDLDRPARIQAFSRGFYKVQRRGDVAVITDLRMGQEPAYVFAFAVARRDGDGRWRPITPEAVGGRADIGRALAWLGPRMLGERLAPPR